MEKYNENLPYIVGKTYDYFMKEESSNRKLELLNATFAQTFRYIGCILLSEYIESEESDFKTNNAINNLIRPSLGSWIGFIRVYLKYKSGKDMFLKELPDAFESLKHSSFEVLKDDIRSTGRQKRDAANAILELRNMLAHGAIPPDEAEAKMIIDIYTPCLQELIKAFAVIFDNYQVVRFEGVEEDFFNDLAVFSSINCSDEIKKRNIELEEKNHNYKKGDLYLISNDDKVLALSVFFNDLLAPEELDNEKYFVYDGLLNRSVVYTGVEHRQYIERYIDAIRSKFSSKEIGMKWKKEGFNYDDFKEYINELSGIAVNLHQKSGKYNPDTYITRKCDGLVKEFLDSDKTAIILKAEAGVGKTSLLCNMTKHIINNNHAVYFVNGATLTNDGSDYPIFAQIKKESLDNKGFRSIYDFLQMMNDYKKPEDKMVFIVDAVNESFDFLSVLEEIDKISSLGNEFPWIKIIVSVRTVSYLILKDRVTDSYGKRFPLFTDKDRYFTSLEYGKINNEVEIKEMTLTEEIAAYEVYRNIYGLTGNSHSFHSLNDEIRELIKNPLNMNIYFKVLHYKKIKQIFTEIDLFEAYHEYLIECELSKTPERLLMMILDKMYKSKCNCIELDEVIEYNEKLTRGMYKSDMITALSPYERLRDMGIIQERHEKRGYVVSFVYQKHLEYLLYQYALNNIHNTDEKVRNFLESILWQELKEGHIAFQNLLIQQKDWYQCIEKVFELGKEKGIDIITLKESLTGLLVRILGNIPEDMEKISEKIIGLLYNNDCLNIGIAVIERLRRASKVPAAECIGAEILKYSNVLDVKEKTIIYYEMGTIFQILCKMKDAVTMFNHILKICDDEEKGKYIVQLARTYRMDGDLEKAMAILNNYVGQHNEEIEQTLYYAQALAQIGIIYYAKGEPAKALEYYYQADDIACSLGEDYFRLYNLLGISVSLEDVNEIEKGRNLLLDVYNESNRLGYQDIFNDSMNGIARKYVKLGQYDEAIYWASEALLLYEYSKDYRGQLVMYALLITSMAKKGKWDEVILEYIDKGNMLKSIVNEHVLIKLFDDAVALNESIKN